MSSSLNKEQIEQHCLRKVETREKPAIVLNSGNHWIVSSLLPSLISYYISCYLDTSPLLTFILFPLVKYSIGIFHKDFMSISMEAALSAIYKLTAPRSAQTSLVPEKGCAGLLRELVSNQEKTMFYTVTVNPSLARELDTKPAPNLKVETISI